MAKATRAKNDFPDTVYFDDWFVKAPVDELVGKTVYIEPRCIVFDTDKAARKLLKEKGVNILSKKDFDEEELDYIIVNSGWMKSRKRYLTKQEKDALEEWKERGLPLRLYWAHIKKELGV